MSDIEIPDYRIQDGCWNCLHGVVETGPDGSESRRCLITIGDKASSLFRGKFVNDAGICGKRKNRHNQG